MFTKKPIFIFLVALLLLVAGGSVYLKSSTKPKIVGMGKPMYLFDIRDDRALIGAVDNVFVAKVLKESGNILKHPYNITETQFDAVVIDNIKGTVHGKISINQVGGYKDNVLYVMDDDILTRAPSDILENYLLKPGQTYIFAVKFDDQNNDFYIGTPYDYRLIEKRDISESDLISEMKNHPRIQELREAYKNEQIPFGENPGPNSYITVYGKDKTVKEDPSSEVIINQ